MSLVLKFKNNNKSKFISITIEMNFATVLFLLSALYNVTSALKGTAQLTYFESYARCCKDSPNYSASAPTTECVSFSAW